MHVAAIPAKTVLVYTDFRPIQNTDVLIWMTKVKLNRAKWSGPTEHSFVCSAHFKQTYFERGLRSQFGINKAMLLPDAIPTIFPLSKKAVKAPTKKRGAFLKRERYVAIQCSRHENML